MRWRRSPGRSVPIPGMRNPGISKVWHWVNPVIRERRWKPSQKPLISTQISRWSGTMKKMSSGSCREIMRRSRHLSVPFQLTLDFTKPGRAAPLAWRDPASSRRRSRSSRRNLGSRRPPPSCWYDKGIALDTLGSTRRPSWPMIQPLRRTPALQPGWYNKALVHTYLGEYGRAQESYDRALALEKDSAVIWFNRGFVLRGRRAGPHRQWRHSAVRLRSPRKWLRHGSTGGSSSGGSTATRKRRSPMIGQSCWTPGTGLHGSINLQSSYGEGSWEAALQGDRYRPDHPRM